ncbi:monosaccharide ABC transporter ATP-binding protein, CUT2 family [Halopenitus malekzadehii]|uniref:Monosaccharide ABC transporter ATP-binding protein, CUT2 family n=1 Tax=Halopenitus malekzadehii TaxID=1267564 RepID=A0A1H6I140_9EURY|nr:ATP-binding cassette domain-containing protein [Halopenitus malekzadehii]SEH42062.1 monosaccharide ABC transporter ATP-binding protein, CUT2 family [Halopenitus malekzadehii]
MSDTNNLLRLKGIEKSFGSIQALKGVSLDVNEGEVLALVGDNGAGKSTLIKNIVGYHQPDAGEIHWKGEQVTFKNPDEALEQGISVVYQDMELIPSLTVARNLFLGKEPTDRFGNLDSDLMYEETKEVLDDIGLGSLNDPNLPAENLSGGESQSIKIGRALHFDADLLILDEPLRNLSVKESEKVLETVERTKEQGIGTIYISHNIFNAYEVADRFHLLDSGATIDEFTKDDIEGPKELIDRMKLVAGQEAE